MKEKISILEFRNWGAFFELEVEEYSYTDVNIARIACNIHNYLFKSNIQMTDVLPFEKNPMTQEEGCTKLKMLFNTLKRGSK